MDLSVGDLILDAAGVRRIVIRSPEYGLYPAATEPSIECLLQRGGKRCGGEVDIEVVDPNTVQLIQAGALPDAGHAWVNMPESLRVRVRAEARKNRGTVRK